MENLDVVQSGIKCDSPDCDYKNDVTYEEYEVWIDAPCPKCGTNLLTEREYKMSKYLHDVLELAKSTFGDSYISDDYGKFEFSFIDKDREFKK